MPTYEQKKDQVKSKLIQNARNQYGEILYCGKATCWAECFTHEDDELAFWFNDTDGNTHVITEDYINET